MITIEMDGKNIDWQILMPHQNTTLEDVISVIQKAIEMVERKITHNKRL